MAGIGRREDKGLGQQACPVLCPENGIGASQVRTIFIIPP